MDSKTLIDSIQEWLHLKSKAPLEAADEPLVPVELFNADQMERHGITLALSHTLRQKSAPDILLKRLSESEKTIIQSCELLGETPDAFSPAREWLLDNFYLIQEQIYSIRRHLPKDYGRELPQLKGTIPGYPRVYAIALEIIEHGDGRWDLENLTRFITAYQSITPLTLGELWAVPIVLGIALIENLSRASKKIVSDRNDRHLATHWADRMLEVAVSEPKKLIIVLADMTRANPPMSSSFVAELVRHLQGAALALPLSWVEQHLAEEGLTIEELVQEENKHQASNQITVSNSIASLRRIGETDWRDFVETTSIVEQILRKDPTGIYSKMDFGSRDRYRHVIERLSKLSGQTQKDVAIAVLELATIQFEKAPLQNPILRASHIGYYLVSDGLLEIERKVDTKLTLWHKIRFYFGERALPTYLSSILFLTALLTMGFVIKSKAEGVSLGWLCFIGIIITLYGSQITIAIVNLISTLLIKPAVLPRMNFSAGIPSEFRTLVVVPTMLTNEESINSLIEGLEVRYLGNKDANLHFMLLTDFNDAIHENMPEDNALLTLAKEKIDELNEEYSTAGNDIFFLLHRARTWNPSENIWMGKERKRGKLSDLNNLLQKNIQTPFTTIVGRIEILSSTKYVITLDTDTQLPRDSARKLVATMAHPLNRPHLDSATQCVIEGYGILQPRVAEALPINGANRYVKLFGSEFGIDPYTRTVSDVYQDLFHEGSFIGKGIYDVEYFQQVLIQRFPNNTILSHDLLEGCYLRSGFLSDVPLYEKSPSNYLADTKRRVRWIRGDWQLISWLFNKIINREGEKVQNPLSFLSKIKLFDNLRRSIVPIALMVLLGLSWTILPTTFFWLGIIIALVILPNTIKFLLELLRKPEDMRSGQHVALTLQTAKHGLEQLLFYIACLPHEAWYSSVAIVRTCWRVFISKRNLLEWTPSDQVDKRLKDTWVEWISHMWMGPVLAVTVLFVLLFETRFESLFWSIPILTLWFSSPFLARWLSQPFQRKQHKLDAIQMRFLHKMARKTWAFFETFMTVENHWLPPDNFQETPIEALARRTSPTNIGLSLLANLTAYDFGYINMQQLLDRTANTLQTLAQLERYRGHFYNWYDTETLAPLLPRYISTVDSGNLAGHLLTLRQGLLALASEPLINLRYLDGLADTIDVLANIKSNKSISSAIKQFRLELKKARAIFKHGSNLTETCNELCNLVEKINTLTESNTKKREWAIKLSSQCTALQEEINLFANTPELKSQFTLHDINQPWAQARLNIINMLVEKIYQFSQMDFTFLYDESSYLMTIGFNVDLQRIDPSHYDLLASEARLGNFVTIAQGQVSQESWFALGRLLVSSEREPTLISWSGSMFEYLMPMLVMPSYAGTLLDQTCHTAVKRQIAYGKQQGVPWGISESGYNAVDINFNYLYRAFGVPGLGLKRGLEDDLVIAPYACVLALMIAPEAACLNLQRMYNDDIEGKFGFYEAVDYTQSRLARDSRKAIVKSFMAHHQGMSFLAYSYLLHDQPMQKRFIADPLFQATLLLLQERIPKPIASYLKVPESPNPGSAFDRQEASMRVFNSPTTRTPQIQLLSSGSYHLMLTQAGGSYSRWKDIAITRWREDSTCDDWGLFCYLRDVNSGEFWSTIYQPTGGAHDNFKAVFTEAHAEFTRSDFQIDSHTEIVVSPEDDIELRRLRIHNRSKVRRTIELTSYGEIALSSQDADLSQPAFNNLFIETELLADQKTILVTRRPQDAHQASPWLFHLLNTYTAKPGTLSFETDRARFVGRGQTLATPNAMLVPGDLSNTQGAVLDPIISIRRRVTLEPDARVTFDLITGIADTREGCIALVEKYQDRRLANRVFDLAWTHGQVLLHQLNITEENAQLYGKIVSAITYTSHARRADPAILASNRRGQSGLWSYSISGDLPIILLCIEDAENLELVRQLIQAQAYWRRKGLLVDIIILNEEHFSYRQTLQEQILNLITANPGPDNCGKIVARIAEQVPLEDKILFQSVAKIILSDKRGTLKEQLSRRRITPAVMPLLKVRSPQRYNLSEKTSLFTNDLQFFNGLGGFNASGDEYIIQLKENAPTPAPWVNVLANPEFGTLVSESGQGYTWTENAHEFRLTPWENDPIKDSASEAYYLRDDETGIIWSPTALPCRGKGDYQTRHGFGYSVFEHIEEGIHTELWIYVAMDAAIKFATLKIRNISTRHRKLSATGYIAWVLGSLRTKNAMQIVTELTQAGVILGQNHYNSEWGDRTAFFNATTSHLELTARTVTGDRREFLGRNGSLQQPAALKRLRLSGRVGAGLDPCGAIQITFDLAEGQSREIVFTLGAGKNKEEAEALAQRYQGSAAAQTVLASTREYWKKTLNILHVKTPDLGLNLLANGWLLYQVLSSRLWGRSGYYQSGGAYGFRDQLQDVMALAQVEPTLLRAHILLCAAHQFEEGDVQHWWHPPLNRGVRTRCSDDYLWLPFAICHYIETTNDMTILDEKIPFLQGRLLNPNEESYYDLPTVSTEHVSVYDHAVRAINNGLKMGEHGLPLMGSGDWNDGMNQVGIEGKGESVWLGFFLFSVLRSFIPIANRYGDHTFTAHWDEESHKLQQNIEEKAWDGEWYRRAYFDNGTPLGSATNKECKIDSIAQSWSVLSGAGEHARTLQAMSSLYQHLVDSRASIIKLLDPPFDNSIPNPGYIQGYVPGIRENGGQYTHAAIWATMAFAKSGNQARAWELFHLLNPVNHGRTSEEINLYKIEPYVVAGDIYSVAPHTGRGGWSWYTGSAGWLYRLITEILLGVRLEEGRKLYLEPIMPNEWNDFTVDYQYQDTLYQISFQRTGDKASLLLDGIASNEHFILLRNDEIVHQIKVIIAAI
jgi:cyclic beta-1,2-glucan synthetase